MASSAETHSLVADKRPDHDVISNCNCCGGSTTHKRSCTEDPRRFCGSCGAQIESPGAWGHDDDCPKRELATA